ncbi:Histone deacetylase associated PHD protein-2 [Mycena chlorophos]|uniref:Histone deacetylase associated PHD protein-2 n=1 Tax=Mycena chlorophos TaxID=658473 RepID=A0A8H6TVZ7_MYCCL|nr:Histone deacetylase associated PHD protein-2 [Mycena chlorophos]
MAATTSLAQPAYLNPPGLSFQPAHLEGDASLATEILPGPPPILSVQNPHKRDPKKPAYSYLYPTDPGSTYSGIVHGTIVAQDDAMNGKRSAVSGRAQRASARNHNGTVPGEAAGPSAAVSDPFVMLVDDDTSPSRAASMPATDDNAVQRGKARAKGKGKAREVDPAVRVKEEPWTVSLNASPDPQINNDDHCSSCRSHGALVYCDGCPRAFHLWCLNPPMEHIDEGESRWFCPACMHRKHPPRKPPPGLFYPLISHLQTTIPAEFQLPEDIRTFFKDVGTGPKGSYIDNSVIRQPRQNRFGLPDDRDSQRLRDKNGDPVLCFKCGMSSLPPGLVAQAPAATTSSRPRRAAAAKAPNLEIWNSIVSCDYCDLHWHLDCLDPPLTKMPPTDKKWMCPNHAEKVLLPKLRIPKMVAPIEITKAKQPNNGNIEIIHSQPAPSRLKKVAVEEVYINGRKYRVPERIVILDFWNKVSKKAATRDEAESSSELLSPLTSLSSFDGFDENPTRKADDELHVAELLCDFQRGVKHQDMDDALLPSTSSQSSRPDHLKRGLSSGSGLTNGHASSTPASSVDPIPSTSTAKRKRNGTSQHYVDSQDSGSVDETFVASGKSVRVKQEDHEPNVLPHKTTATSSRGRPIRRASYKGLDRDDAPKRGKKRKERDGESSEDDVVDAEEPKKSRVEKSKSRKPASSSPKKVAGGSPGQGQAPLTIRLPPLSGLANRLSPSKPPAASMAPKAIPMEMDTADTGPVE